MESIPKIWYFYHEIIKRNVVDELENIQRKLAELLKSTEGKYLIMEEEIDIEIQKDYFENSQLVELSDGAKYPIFWEQLYDSNLDLETKKNVLNQMAKVNDVKAFRFLETFLKTLTNEDFKPWALLALQESRMLIYTDLMQEEQFFISTGLGGKGTKLRYIIISHSKDLKPFSKYQIDLLQGEVEHYFKKSECEIERLEFGSNYLNMKVLIPLNVNITDTMLSVINECNQMGDFVSKDFLITNIKPLSKEEIEEILLNKNKDS